ncbi:MAG: antitoxin [Desulfobacterales bacterium]|nr:antitoxin [Desulfobacterales bacterium]
MNTKLTLRLEKDLIESAKRHASNYGTSVSQMVADYFYLLDKNALTKSVQVTPLVKSIKGSLNDPNIDKKDYKKYLEEKYL